MAEQRYYGQTHRITGTKLSASNAPHQHVGYKVMSMTKELLEKMVEKEGSMDNLKEYELDIEIHLGPKAKEKSAT